MSADISSPGQALIAPSTVTDPSHEGNVTNAEREAVLGLIDPETGATNPKNSSDAAQAFNRKVTKAIFGMKGGGSWDHELHFNRAKAVVLTMAARGEIEPIYNDRFAIVGIKLSDGEVVDVDGEIIDPRQILISQTLGRLATASQKLTAEENYHAVADEMLDSVLAENEVLTSQNTTLAAENARLRQELEDRQAEMELREKIASLDAQLAAAQTARQVAEGRTEAVQGQIDTLKQQLRSAKTKVRDTDRARRDAERDLAEAHKQTEEAREKGQIEGWMDGLRTIKNILVAAGYEEAGPVVKALVEHSNFDEINKIYYMLNDLLDAEEALRKVGDRNCRVIKVWDQVTMLTATDRQRAQATEKLEQAMKNIRAAIRLAVDAIVYGEDKITES